MAKIAVHPGGFIRRNYMEPFDITAAQLARALDVSAASLSRLLNESADLSPQMAMKLSKVLGRSPTSWMNMQTNYTISRLEAGTADWEPSIVMGEDGLVQVA